MSKIYLYGLKKTCLGCFRIEEIRDKDNETDLKEEGGIEMSNYSAFHIRDARSLSLLKYFTSNNNPPVNIPTKEPKNLNPQTVVCVCPTSLLLPSHVNSNATFSTTNASAMTSLINKPKVAKNINMQVSTVEGGGRKAPKTNQEMEQQMMPMYK